MTRQPSPVLPANLSAISIVAKHAVESRESGDFESAAVSTGAGPYRLVSFGRNDRAVMERNPSYWGERPEWDRVEMRFIANEGARSAALLAGDVDLIDSPSRNDLPRLRRDNRFRVVSVPGNRPIMLLPNFRAVRSRKLRLAVKLARSPNNVTMPRDRITRPFSTAPAVLRTV